VLETDNQALSWLLSHPRQLGKIGRWVAKISALKFQVRHIRGTQNIIADTLSQMFESAPVNESPTVQCNLTLANFPLAFNDLKQLQVQDRELNEIWNKLSQGDKVAHYCLDRGVLYWRAKGRQNRKLVILESARAMVFAYFHESPLGGHLGVLKPWLRYASTFAGKEWTPKFEKRYVSVILAL
jgi:hypothetical protein